MVPASQVLAELDDSEDRVVLDLDGNRLGLDPPVTGEACLLVGTVTNALKILDGDRLAASLDRDRLVAVIGFVLHRDVLSGLGDAPISGRATFDEVTASGRVWTAYRMEPPDPFRPFIAQ